GSPATDPSALLDAVRSPIPVPVAGLAGAVAVSAGVYHSCAIVADGTARCWGSNGVGQLGDGTANDFTDAPAVVKGLAKATTIAAGGGHTCASLADGTVQCWGWNVSGELGDATNAQRN